MQNLVLHQHQHCHCHHWSFQSYSIRLGHWKIQNNGRNDCRYQTQYRKLIYLFSTGKSSRSNSFFPPFTKMMIKWNFNICFLFMYFISFYNNLFDVWCSFFMYKNYWYVYWVFRMYVCTIHSKQCFSNWVGLST